MAITSLLPSILLMIQKLRFTLQSFPSLSNLFINICNDLDRLKKSATSIQAVVNDAQEKAEKDMDLRSLLNKLKDAAYDAEDVIDELCFNLTPQPSAKGCSSITSLAYRIRATKERFEDISCQLYALDLKESNRSIRVPKSFGETLEHNILYGREDDMRNVIELLLERKPDNPCVVVPLVGTEGIGKTTIAQFIYNDPRICKHFDRKAWVFVSKHFDLIMLIRAILESITLSSWTWAEPINVQQSLEYELERKRFLIVLDGFCTESSSLWEPVRASMSHGRIGSKILLVTREESVANAFQTMQSYHLKRLSKENCWQLFQHYALPSHDHGMDQTLMSIGKRISEKCNGMLLPIKMLGATLHSETDRFTWEAICESDIWDSSGLQSLVLPAFKISYASLLPQLQSCLAYCSLFPKVQLFEKDQLIRLWMAQGYINPVEGKRLEEIGCEYFNELTRRSFLHISHANKQAFVVHPQIFDMLQSILGDEIYKIEDVKECHVQEKARHLSYITEKDGAVVELKCSAECTSLRTFLVITKSQSSSFRRFSCKEDLIHLSFSNDVVINMKCLRALDLSYTGIKELPDSIGSLIHLRFLGLNSTKMRTLPQSFCNLYNLQTLELQDCSYFLALPVGISSLFNLHYLGISKAYSFALIPCGIGKLTSLSTLSTFYIGIDSSYYVIRELENLVNLRGEFCISGLSNVISVDDAMAANLKTKEFIEKLILEWRSNDVRSESYIIRHVLNDHVGEEENLLEQEENAILQNEGEETNGDEAQWITQIDISYKQVKKSREERLLHRKAVLELREGVLESLQPHSNLKELVMENYEGSKLARWMGDSCLLKLVSITLSNCYKCEVFPALGQLPFLKYLLLKGFKKLKYVGDEFCGHKGNDMKPFTSLEKLEFEGMYAWEEWKGVDGAFPHLLELSLHYCHKLRTMPQGFPSLEKLKLKHCTELISFPTLPLLKSLDVFHCNKMMMSTLPEQIVKLGSLKIYCEKFADFTLC